MKNKTTKTKVKNSVITESKLTNDNVIDNNESLKNDISKLESAYIEAISGKMKFGQVKDIFKKIHKKIKETAKS